MSDCLRYRDVHVLTKCQRSGKVLVAHWDCGLFCHLSAIDSTSMPYSAFHVVSLSEPIGFTSVAISFNIADYGSHVNREIKVDKRVLNFDYGRSVVW